MRVFVQSFSPPSPKASTLLETGLVSFNDKSWSNTEISDCSELEALDLWKASNGRRHQEASRSDAWATLTDSLNTYIQNLNPQSRFFVVVLFFVLFFCCPPKAHDRSWGLERRLTGFAFRLSSLFTTSLAQCLRYSADATWIQLSISGYISPSLVNKTLSYLICFTCSGCSHRLLASDLEE